MMFTALSSDTQLYEIITYPLSVNDAMDYSILTDLIKKKII